MSSRGFGPDLYILQASSLGDSAPTDRWQGTSRPGAPRAGASGDAPIFFGDELSDERAFAVLPGGITIYVGQNLHTRARFFLRDPDEVMAFLLKLEAEIG